MNIKQIILEEMDSFEWAKGDVEIHVGMCLQYNTKKYEVTHINDHKGLEIQAQVYGEWDRDDDATPRLFSLDRVRLWLVDGTMTFCQY